MALLDTKVLLSDLIGMGPDAYSNLFKIEMTGLPSMENIGIPSGDDLKKICARTTSFISPQRGSSSEAIPYQNITVEIPTSGTDLPRKMDMTIRLDSEYKAYDVLRRLQLVNNDGYYEKDPNKMIGQMHVQAFDTKQGMLSPVYEWTFYNIYVLSLTKLTFGYEGSNALNFNISLIWERYEEGIPRN